MASESVCRGWHRVNVDGEITGGCGECERCYLAACVYVKTFASEVKLMRKVAELMSKYIDEERLQNVSMEDWINHARRELESEGSRERQDVPQHEN